MSLTPRTKKKLLISLALLVVVIGALGSFVWRKFFHEIDQPAFADEAERFQQLLRQALEILKTK